VQRETAGNRRDEEYEVPPRYTSAPRARPNVNLRATCPASVAGLCSPRRRLPMCSLFAADATHNSRSKRERPRLRSRDLPIIALPVACYLYSSTLVDGVTFVWIETNALTLCCVVLRNSISLLISRDWWIHEVLLSALYSAWKVGLSMGVYIHWGRCSKRITFKGGFVRLQGEYLSNDRIIFMLFKMYLI